MALSHLPTELIEEIASYLDLPSSRSFRLTNPSLSKQISHVFKDRFFCQHTLQWTEAAFSRLLEITSHSHFGNALRHLVIDATPRHSIHLWQAGVQISETQAIPTPYGAVSATRGLEEKYAADHKVADDVATFFSETRFDRKSLTTIFGRLQHLDSITFAYEGMHENYAKFGRRYCQSSQQEMSRPFVSTMSAIVESRLQVRRIQVDSEKHFGAVSIGKLEAMAPSLCFFGHAFEKLDTLHLHLRDLRSAVSGFELETTRPPFVVRFLAKAHNIRRLELSCYSIWEQDVFRQIARQCEYKKLEVCKLSMMRIMEAEDLLTFLQHADKTLVSLSLQHIMFLNSHVTWWHLLGRVAAERDLLPCLQTLSLGYLNGHAQLRMWLDGTQVRRFVGHDWKRQLSEAVDRIEMRAAELPWRMGALSYPFVGWSM